MHAIGVVESGRKDEQGGVTAWPWTINAEGKGAYFNTKAEAIAAVTELRGRGVRSIDVGCMQVNLRYHPEAFASLDEAFDPSANARYAARFLQRLFGQTGSWPAAASGYHSLNPEFGGPYGRKVLAVWESSPPVTPAQAVSQAAPVQQSFAQTGVVPARVISLPAVANAGGATGRGLDSYRAMPTRLVSSASPGRG